MVELRKRSEAGGAGAETRVSSGVDVYGVKAGDGLVVTPLGVRCPVSGCTSFLSESEGGVVCGLGHGGVVAREVFREVFREATETHVRATATMWADAGQSVSVTWGDEFFQIVQYNGFRVGPFQATTVVREGETIADATLRAYRALAEAARRIRTEKAREHLDALKELGIGHR